MRLSRVKRASDGCMKFEALGNCQIENHIIKKLDTYLVQRRHQALVSF